MDKNIRGVWKITEKGKAELSRLSLIDKPFPKAASFQDQEVLNYTNGPKVPKSDEKELLELILEEIAPDGPKQFPEDFLDSSVNKEKTKEVSLPDEPLRLGNYFFGEQEVITDSGFIYKAKSPLEAKYLIYAQRPGISKVLVPTDTMPLFKTVKNYENYLRNLQTEMAKALLNRTLDQQMAEQLLKQFLEENQLPEMESE